MTSKGVENMVAGAVFGLTLAFFALVVAWNIETDKDRGIVYALWPNQECRHVEPAARFSCDNLPPIIDDIVWVSREWKP